MIIKAVPGTVLTWCVKVLSVLVSQYCWDMELLGNSLWINEREKIAVFGVRVDVPCSLKGILFLFRSSGAVIVRKF